MDKIIEAQSLMRTYKQGDINVEVLNGIEFSIAPAEQVAIVGSSGSGKSTLLHLLGSLDKPTSGKIIICNKDASLLNEAERASLRNKNLGFVYQFHHLLAEFTALENVAMPLLIARVDVEQALASAELLLTSLGMKKRLKHKPSELSGGERQRVAIARGLVNKPKCLLADEPTGNLDQQTAGEVFELLAQTNELKQTALILVTHDMSLAKKLKFGYQLVNGVLEQVW